MKVMVIEGNTQQLDGGAMFGNVPREVWKQWARPDERNRIPLAARSLLLQTDGGKNILFDTGIGAFFEPKLKERYGVVETEHLLLKELALQGLKEADIDAVVLSHLHFDHAGGLLPAFGSSEERLLFPNAFYYVGSLHWERAMHPHMRDRASFIPIIHDLLKKSGRLKFIDQKDHPDLDFGVEFRLSHGHTVGMLIALLHLSSGPLALVSDLIPGLPWVHLPFTMGYDRFAELLIDEKKQIYEEFTDRRIKLFFPHDPAVAAAWLRRDASGKYYGEPVPQGNAA